MKNDHRTVSRVIDILEFVAAEPDGRTLIQITEHLQAARSSVYELVQGLVSRGYLVAVERNQFVMGPGVNAILTSGATPIVSLADPLMRKLVASVNETVTLAVPVGNEVIYVHSIPSTHPVVYAPRMNVRRSMWPTSAGKLFLALSGYANVLTYRRVLEAESSTVKLELSEIERRGYATNIGESETDVAAVSVGIWIDELLVGAVSIGGPRVRIESHLIDIAHEARRTFDKLGEQ